MGEKLLYNYRDSCIAVVSTNSFGVGGPDRIVLATYE